MSVVVSGLTLPTFLCWCFPSSSFSTCSYYIRHDILNRGMTNFCFHTVLHMHIRSFWFIFKVYEQLNEFCGESVLKCCLFSATAGGAGTQTSWIQGGEKKDPDAPNFKRLKLWFVLTVRSELTQSVLMVQNFNLLAAAQKSLMHEKKSYPVCGLCFKMGMS